MNKSNLSSKKDEIQTHPLVIKWIEGLQPSTQISYIYTLARFCIITEKTPQELLNTAYTEQEKRVPPWEQSIEKWFDSYKKYFIKTKGSKNTFNVKRGIISNFFHFYKIATPKDNPRRSSNNLTVKNERKGLIKADIREAVNVAKTFKIKALILAQATSGLSQIDLLKLDLKDFKKGLITLDEDHQICSIWNKRQKTGQEHWTFFSSEAVEMIQKYLTLERVKPKGPLFASAKSNNNRYTGQAHRHALIRVNKLLGWSNEGNYHKLTSHMLRKFFQTQLTDSGMIAEHITHMMGWKLPGMRQHYYLANKDEIKRSYIKHLSCLTLENIEVKQIITDDVERMKYLEDRVSELAKELQSIQERERALKTMRDSIK